MTTLKFLINNQKLIISQIYFIVNSCFKKTFKFGLCTVALCWITPNYAETANERSFRQLFSNNNPAFTNIPHQTAVPSQFKPNHQKPNASKYEKPKRGNHPQRHYPDKRHYHSSQPDVVFIYELPTQVKYEYNQKSFVVGQFLPTAYRSDQYRINDWAVRRLSQPLNGQYWFALENQFLLVDDDSYEILAVQ